MSQSMNSNGSLLDERSHVEPHFTGLQSFCQVISVEIRVAGAELGGGQAPVEINNGEGHCCHDSGDHCSE
eukprot:1579411-Amphidinium_carterae.1